MRKMCICTLCVAVVCMVWAMPARAFGGDERDQARAAIGKPAPPFTLTDTTGEKHSLEDILKKDDVKAVVLEWFNHDCPYCARHGKAKTMSNLVSKYKDKGVVWLGIDTTYLHEDKESQINEVIKKWGVNYPILTDFDGKVGHNYGAKSTPHMFVIDSKGTLVYQGAIDDDARGSKSASERTNYVAAALDQVLAGETVAKAQTKSYGCSVKYQQ